jgi:hypothetical protein
VKHSSGGGVFNLRVGAGAHNTEGIQVRGRGVVGSSSTIAAAAAAASSSIVVLLYYCYCVVSN